MTRNASASSQIAQRSGKECHQFNALDVGVIENLPRLNLEANMTWKISGKATLPLADREREWDGDAARDRIFAWANWDDDPDPAKARSAFFAYDDEDPDLRGAYKLPFADVIGGELKAVPRGIFAVAGVLDGARDGVDLPADVKKAVRRRVAGYYKKMGDDPPWDNA